jgi:hypothetical protein
MKWKILLAALVSSILIISCSSSNKTVSYSEDKAFYDKLKKFKKNPADTQLKREVQDYFDQAMKMHEDRIAAYRLSPDLNRYDKILLEYNTMQSIGETIRTSAAYNLISTVNYFEVIELTRQEAAAAWYNKGLDYLGSEDRNDGKRAYDAFGKASQYVANYKDAAQQMQTAFNKSIVNVVINPVTDNNIYFPTSGGYGYNNSFSRNYLQESLVRDLGGQNANSIPARFYTDWDAQRANIDADLVVDLAWNNLYVPQPSTSRYNRPVSKSVSIGTDTSGKPIYKTVNATVHVTRTYITANGEMEYRISDPFARTTVARSTVNSSYSWQEEYATYSGDSRALDSHDWAMINNNNFRTPSRGEVMEELYRRIYPDLKSRLRNEIDW